jgi:hypothetical protein
MKQDTLLFTKNFGENTLPGHGRSGYDYPGIVRNYYSIDFELFLLFRAMERAPEVSGKFITRIP